MKLSLEEKVKYVLQYNKGEVIKTPDDAKSRSSFMGSLCEWAKRYNIEGEAGLKRKKNKTCTEGAIFHSDQGWQYQMKEFGTMLADLKITQSMSRKGNCHDNSVIENFFGRLKVEMFYGEEKTFRDYNDFRKKLEEYISWYNRNRIILLQQFQY